MTLSDNDTRNLRDVALAIERGVIDPVELQRRWFDYLEEEVLPDLPDIREMFGQEPVNTVHIVPEGRWN